LSGLMRLNAHADKGAAWSFLGDFIKGFVRDFIRNIIRDHFRNLVSDHFRKFLKPILAFNSQS